MPDKLPQYYVIKEHPLRIISKCKRHSKGTLMSFLVGVFMIYVVLNWVPELLSLVFPVTNVDLMSRMEGVDLQLIQRMPRTPMVVYFYSLLFSGVFRLGEALYTLTYIRNKRIEYRAITEAFGLYLKALWVYVIQIIIVAFWSIFFIVPGLIAAINFSQAFYILADDPHKGVLQILAESKMMMSGNKLSYVRLILYYVPYLMLSYVPSFLISDVVYKYSLTGFPMTLLAMLSEITIFAANGYMCLGRAVFYELLTNESFATFRYAGQDAFREDE